MLVTIPDEETLVKAARLLDAMSNKKRLEILSLIIRNEISVGPLATQVGLSPSAMSQHLHKLRLAKLVQSRRDAQTIYYSCASTEVSKVLDVLEQIFATATSTARDAD
jgi:DNA-binding transcriptional ArsR family regulator